MKNNSPGKSLMTCQKKCCLGKMERTINLKSRTSATEKMKETGFKSTI